MEVAKQINIVSLKLVKESSVHYKECSVRPPENRYPLMSTTLGTKSSI